MSEQPATLYPTGIALCGLHVGESPEDRQKALDAALATVPTSLPRVLQGAGSVADIVAAVGSGMDLIDSPLPTAASCCNVALVFPLPSQLLSGFPAAAATRVPASD